MNIVEVFVKLTNAHTFVSEAGEVSKSVKGIGTDAETSGKKAQTGWKGLAKWAGGAAAIYGVARGVESAVGATTDLAKSTAQLQRMTGMDTVTASEWVGVMKERGISSQQTSVAIKTLSKQMEVARLGTNAESSTVAKLRAQSDQVNAAVGKGAPAALSKLTNAIAKAQGQGEKARLTMQQLGVPLKDLQKGNTEDVLMHVADALKAMQNPAERSALMIKLFGRSGVALLPVLMQGSSGIRKLLDQQKEYGNYLSGKSLADTKKAILQQRELETAWNGLKVQLGQGLLPVLVMVAKALLALIKAFEPLLKHPKVVLGLVIGLTSALIAYQVALLAATIAETFFNAELGITALLIGGAFIAVIALVAGFVILYKRVGWFHDAVLAVFNWVKANWKLLLIILVSPIVGAVLLIIKYWAQIKAGLLDVWNWINGHWPLVLGIIAGPIGVAVGEVINHWAQLKQAGADAIHYIEGLVDDLVKKILSIPNAVKTAASHLPGVHAIASAGHAVTHLFGGQGGGVVPHTTPVLVGERGPEIVVLPRASQVVPLQWGAHAPAAATGSEHRPLVIEVPVMIHGREVARAVAQVTADRMARR
jgi:TP901 family phage tail tape measure protein